MRQKMLRLFGEGKKIPEIMTACNASYYQVYNAVSGRVKTKYSPRRDKGIPKGEKATNAIDMNQFDSVDGFMKHKLMEALKDLNERRYDAAELVKIIKDVAMIERQINDRELQRYLRRPDAVLIARIMRRLSPALTDDEIIVIFKEEHEKLITESKSNV